MGRLICRVFFFFLGGGGEILRSCTYCSLSSLSLLIRFSSRTFHDSYYKANKYRCISHEILPGKKTAQFHVHKRMKSQKALTVNPFSPKISELILPTYTIHFSVG